MTAPRCTEAPAGLTGEIAEGYRAHLPVIETERLRLRAPTLHDLPVWTAIYAEPDNGLGGPVGAERAWEEFCTYTAGWLLHGHGLFSVICKAEGATVGFILVGLEWGDEEPELGWMFTATARGKGYAGEAASAARDWALQLLPGLVSYIDPGHAPSNRLAQRLGARRDGSAEDRLAARDGQPVNVWRHGDPR